MLLWAGGITCLFIFACLLISKPDTDSEMTHVPVDRERQKCKSPIELWLYDSLKMRGFVVEAKVPCGPYEMDLSLPNQKIAIHCTPLSAAAQKVHWKEKDLYLKRHGWRTITIRPQCIYNDFNDKLRAIDVYMQN